MTSKLILIAYIKAAKENVNFVKNELLNIIAPTRAEAGCLQYDLHQDNEDPNIFVLYEIWESREHWLAHMETQHLKKCLAAIENTVNFSVNEMTKL